MLYYIILYYTTYREQNKTLLNNRIPGLISKSWRRPPSLAMAKASAMLPTFKTPAMMTETIEPNIKSDWNTSRKHFTGLKIHFDWSKKKSIKCGASSLAGQTINTFIKGCFDLGFVKSFYTNNGTNYLWKTYSFLNDLFFTQLLVQIFVKPFYKY